MAEFIKIFISGIILGNGPCLITCTPLVLPYIVGFPQSSSESKVWKVGLKLSVIFSISRLIAYSLLGFLSVVFYRFVFGVLGANRAYLQLFLGILIVFYGLLFLFGVNQRFIVSHPVCASFYAKAAGKMKFNMLLFGLLVGFSPCAPLLSVLTYIAATAKNPLGGLLAGFSFGLGTIITLIIPLGALAGFMVDKIKKSSGFLMAVRCLSATLLIYFGVNLILKGMFLI
jgi:sulfite exporter TauE/SafE